jgi:hypothetical protein
VAGYVEREDFDVTVDRIAALLDGGSVDPELAEAARALIKAHYLKFLRFVVGGRSAVDAEKVGQPRTRTEPSDFSLRLVAALTANDRDAFDTLAHDVRISAGVVP